MKHSFQHLSALCAALLLAACTSPHAVEFKEADFSIDPALGSGTVSGKTFRVRTGSNLVEVTGGTVVSLIPANAYTNEIVQRKYSERERLKRADPRLAKYIRKTQTDDRGHFEFTSVPSGAYYVSSDVKWTEHIKGEDTSPVETEKRDTQWLSERIWVKSGKTTLVTGWGQGE